MKFQSFIVLAVFTFLASIPSTAFSAEGDAADILKDAVQGAITGAVSASQAAAGTAKDAAKGTGGQMQNILGTSSSSTEDSDAGHNKDNKKKKKDKKHPYGWTQGEKTGWGGKDLPPGLAKKKDAETNISVKKRDHEKWKKENEMGREKRDKKKEKKHR